MTGKVYVGYDNVAASTAEYEQTIVKSARRVLQVFEFFAEHHQAANATDIALSLDFPQSSTSMLLRSLATLGYLQYDPVTRLFEPSLRLSLLGTWRPERTTVVADVIATMERLRDKTGETVLLAEPYRHHVRYIHVLHGEDRRYYTPNGTLRPICSTAFGQMLLTLKSEREVRSIIHRARTDQDSLDYGVSVDDVLADVKRCREEGYAHTCRSVGDFHSFQIAVLLPETHESPALAIGVMSHEQRAGARKVDLLRALYETLGRADPGATIRPPSEAIPASSF